MSLPSKLPYSPPLLSDCDGADMLSEDVGRAGLDGWRLAAGLPAGRRAAGRARAAVDLGRRDVPELVPAGVSGFSALAAVVRLAAVARVVVRGVVVAAARRLVVVLGVGAARRAGAAAVTFAVDIFFAASVRALAAAIMALVAVFIDCMADDIVFADAVALVAADVIFVAADVTLVAADDTFLAATAGVAAPPAAGRRAVVRAAVVRAAVPRVVVPRRPAAVRDTVDRDAGLRVDRGAVPLAVEVVDRADLVVVLRDLDVAPDDLELELGCDRLAVPLDALRLTDLLRAVLAGLRRAAARVVD